MALWFVDTFKELMKNTTGRIKSKQNWLNDNLLKIFTTTTVLGHSYMYSCYLDEVFTDEHWLKLIKLAKFYNEKPEFTKKNLVQQIVWDNQTFSTDEQKFTE